MTEQVLDFGARNPRASPFAWVWAHGVMEDSMQLAELVEGAPAHGEASGGGQGERGSKVKSCLHMS